MWQTGPCGKTLDTVNKHPQLTYVTTASKRKHKLSQSILNEHIYTIRIWRHELN